MPIPWVDTIRDTGYVVRAALQSPPGKTILGSGDSLSWSDWFKVWCEVHKVPFGGYDEIPIETYVNSFPMPELAGEFAEMFAYFDEFGYTGGDGDVVNAKDVSPIDDAFSDTADQESQLGVPCPLTTWEEHVKLEPVWADAL